MCVRQMRPPGRGDFWILKIAHAPSPKNLSKNGFCPRKGVAFLWKAFLQKKFSMPGSLSELAIAQKSWLLLLVWERRSDSTPSVVCEFVQHDSGPQAS